VTQAVTKHKEQPACTRYSWSYIAAQTSSAENWKWEINTLLSNQ